MSLSALYVFRGKQGIQGPIGPTGPAASTTSSYIISSPVAITSSGSITISASLASTGTLTFHGQLAIEAASNADVTVVPRVGGVNRTTMNSKSTISSTKFGSVPVSGQVAVTAGDAFQLTVSFSAGNGAVNSGAILFFIQ